MSMDIYVIIKVDIYSIYKSKRCRKEDVYNKTGLKAMRYWRVEGD